MKEHNPHCHSDGREAVRKDSFPSLLFKQQFTRPKDPSLSLRDAQDDRAMDCAS